MCVPGPGGPAVFRRLGALHVHDLIRIQRADGAIVVYAVDLIRAYPKGRLPAMRLYAATPYPSLQLITCGGILPGQRPGNVVVSAHETAVVAG